jgi:hypothetical protein
MIGERISQYILKSKTNRKTKAASPPRKKRMETRSQMLDMMFLTFASLVAQRMRQIRTGNDLF